MAVAAAGRGTPVRPPECSRPPMRLSESSRRKARRASGTTCSSRKGSCGSSSSGSTTGSGGGRGSILALGSTSRDVTDGRIALVGRTAETGGKEAFPRDAGNPVSALSGRSDWDARRAPYAGTIAPKPCYHFSRKDPENSNRDGGGPFPMLRDTRVSDAATTPTGPAAPSGERRQVTALFADMVGFTAISERLGEEGTFALIQPIYELMASAVREQGGSVKDFTGDGIMALFGVPDALEDGPLRACRAALAIHERLAAAAAAIEAKHGVRPQMRIGVNSGLAVVTQIRGESGPMTALERYPSEVNR